MPALLLGGRFSPDNTKDRCDYDLGCMPNPHTFAVEFI